MFHRILVGIDGSCRTEVIVNAAAGLALAAGAFVRWCRLLGQFGG